MRKLFLGLMLGFSFFQESHSGYTPIDTLEGLPQDIMAKVMPHLLPEEREKLYMTGSKPLIGTIERYEKKSLELAWEGQEALEVAVRRAFPDLMESYRLYGSLLNLVTHFDEIATYRQSVQTALPQARVLDLLAQFKGQTTAIIWKLYGLHLEEGGYHGGQSQAHSFIEAELEKGEVYAFWAKLKGLFEGKYGYQQSLSQAYFLIEEQIAQGNNDVAYLKLEGLAGLEGEIWEGQGWVEIRDMLYPQNLAKARTFIDEMASQERGLGIHLKVGGLCEGKFGYPLNIPEAHAFLNELIAGGNSFALTLKFEGHRDHKYGFSHDYKRAHSLLDEEIKKRNPEAIRLKLAEVKGGRLQDLPYPHSLIEELASQGNPVAIKLKLGELFGEHPHGEEQANHDFIEDQVKKRNMDAIRLKYVSLRERKNGYPKDEIRAKEVWDEEDEKLYREAFFLKIAPLSQEMIQLKTRHVIYEEGDKGSNDLEISGFGKDQYLYMQKEESAREFIQAEIKKGNVVGFYAHLFGLMLGYFGVDQDNVQAGQFLERLFGVSMLIKDLTKEQSAHPEPQASSSTDAH